MSASTDSRRVDLEALRGFMGGEWDRAVADAGLDPETVAYWIADETPDEIRDRGAMYFTPGRDPDPPYALTDEQYAEATSPEFCGRHRIVIHLDYELPAGLSDDAVKAYFAAVIRHELEHARQQQAQGGQEALEVDQNLVDPVLSHKAGGIKGGAVFYNYKPMEMDANAAAAVYVRTHYGDVVDELLETSIANMVRSNTVPEDPGSLLRRTVCFLFQFRLIAERLADPIPVAEHLRLYGGHEAAELWEFLTACSRS